MILLVQTWKLWTVPTLVVIGVGGFILRGLFDMLGNWETGYGPNSKKASRQAFTILITFILTAIAIGLFGCSHLTVAPKAVNAHAIAFDKNQQTAGLIDCDSNGCKVTRNWLDKYRQLEAEFKQTFPGDANIKVEGDHYRAPFDVVEFYTQLKAKERGQ